jgi:hypothetical protein
MSRSSQVIGLVIGGVFLIAAVIAVMPGSSGSKTSAIVAVSVLGVVAALVQLAQTSALQRLLRGPISVKRVGTAQLLTHLADRQLLLRAEAAGHQPIYQLDTDYWTNLELDFSGLAKDRTSLDLLAGLILRELGPRQDALRIVEPLDIGESASDARRVIDGIRQRLARRQFISAQDIHRHNDVVLLAGTYTAGVRSFLHQQGDHITAAVFLVGPDSRYLESKFRGLRLRSVSVISADALRQLDARVRRSMVWYR